MDELNDLILKAGHGNEYAFEKLCEQYKPLIEGCAFRYAEDSDEKEDFFQESRLAFYRAVQTYKIENGKVTFGAYAKKCIRNRLISCIRKKNSKKRKHGEIVSLSDDIASAKASKKQQLRNFPFASLSYFEKQVLEYYLDGCMPREIAKKTGIEIKSINNALCRVRRKFKTKQ